MSIKKRRKRSEHTRHAPTQFVASLEFASTQIPNRIVLSGWLIHDSQRPIRWGLVAQESYQDISDKMTIYSRPDLKEYDESSDCTRVGFIAFIEGEWPSPNAVQLTVGTLENPMQLCVVVAECHNSDINSYFSQSHQLFRFATAQCIAALSEAEAGVVARITNFALPNWIKEIAFFDGALHQNVPAGVDHNICTTNGDCYVEGWIGSLGGRNFQLSACLLGVHSSHTLLQRSAFRRPDIPGHDEFAGFAFVGRAQLAIGRNPIVLLQSQFTDTDEVTYSKINLRQIDAQNFARTFWSRTLDINSISRRALRQILSFIGQSHARGNGIAPATFIRKIRSGNVAALVLKNDEDSALRNLFILTSRLAEYNFSKVVLVAADPAATDVWWPNAEEMLILSPVPTLSEALGWIEAPLLLIVDASLMANQNFAADVRAATKLLETKPNINCVVFSNKGFVNGHSARDQISIEVRVPDNGAPAWFHLCKGTTTPPILLRTNALRDFVRQAWPQPSAALIIRNYLKIVSPDILWLESTNVEAFYTRPYVPILSADQADLLYQIDAQL
jgi:hypothetical protein